MARRVLITCGMRNKTDTLQTIDLSQLADVTGGLFGRGLFNGPLRNWLRGGRAEASGGQSSCASGGCPSGNCG